MGPQVSRPELLSAAAARLAEGEVRAAQGLLARALRRDPRDAFAWGLKAECLEKQGEMQAAVAAADHALSLAPREPALHELKGHCLFHRKDYAGAAKSFSRGLKLAPDSTALLARRANALWLSGLRAGAVEDLRRCVRLAPQDLERRLALLRLEILSGRGAKVLPELERLGRSPLPAQAAGAAYLKGVHLFRSGRYLASAREFEKAETAAREGHYPGRFIDAGYSRMARGFEFMRRHKRSTRRGERAQLILTGLGLDYPRQATLEVLQILSDCDIVVNNLAGAEAMEFLSFFCRDVRTVSFEGEQPQRWADKIFGWIKPGNRVAFVTRGHPLVSGHLALSLLRRARRRGVEVGCYSAISSVDQMLSLTQEVLSETSWGLQVMDSQLLLTGKARPQPGLPLLLYLASAPNAPGHRRAVARLCAAVRESYPDGQRVLLFGPRYDSRKLQELRVAGLEEFLARLERRMYSSTILLFPPARRLTPARPAGLTARRH